MTPDAATEHELLHEVGRACASLVDEIRGAAVGSDLSGAQLSILAEDAFGRFTGGLLTTLLAATAQRPDAESDAWVRQHFHAWLDHAGSGMRGALAESRVRHRVAQSLQGKMFEADAALRRALGLRQGMQSRADVA